MTHKEVKSVSYNDNTLNELLERQKRLESSVSRIEGRVEEAKERLSALEEECKAKGVDPNALGEVISKLEIKIEKMTAEYENDLNDAEAKINQIMESVKTGNQ